VLFVVAEFLNLCVQSVLLKFEFLRLVTQDFVFDLRLQTKHCLFEEGEQATRAVKLVDQLVAFFKEFGGNDVFDVLGGILNSSLQVRDLLVFQIDHLQVVFFFLTEEIRATLEFLLPINDDFPAECRQGLIEVSNSEDDTRSTCQCLYLRAPIAQLGQELLNKAQLLYQVEMRLYVNLVVESRSKLLERVDAHLDLGL